MKKFFDSKLAILIILVVLILIFSFVFFKILNNFTFYVTFSKAANLKKGDAVYLNGAEIGNVKDIEYKGNKIYVTVLVQKKYKKSLTSDSKFSIATDTFITGKKCIKVKLGKSPLPIKKGQIIKGNEGIRGLFNSIKSKF
jgi:ABC-type transporter Mla subunit MlaD